MFLTEWRKNARYLAQIRKGQTSENQKMGPEWTGILDKDLFVIVTVLSKKTVAHLEGHVTTR